MKNKVFKILAILFLSNCTIAHAQYDFLLQDKYNGFTTKDGKGYVEIEIRDSTNIDSYIGAIYSTLAESYPRAEIQTIGTRSVRLDATSKGITTAIVQGGMLKMFVDFSLVFEVREHPDKIRYYTDSLGITHPSNDYHQVRVYAPIVKKITFYNPYYHPEVKEYISEKTEMHEALMEKAHVGNESYAKVFIRELQIYILGNIRAELNQNYYMELDGDRYGLGRKQKRID